MDTPVDNGDTLTVIFQIRCGLLDSLDNGGLAQEKIVNKTSFGTSLPDDANFTPAYPNARFYLNNPTIVDIKSSNVNSTGWASWNVGDVFYSATQEMRLVFIDQCGVTQTLPLGSVRLRRRKVSPTQWQLERQ